MTNNTTRDQRGWSPPRTRSGTQYTPAASHHLHHQHNRATPSQTNTATPVDLTDSTNTTNGNLQDLQHTSMSSNAATQESASSNTPTTMPSSTTQNINGWYQPQVPFQPHYMQPPFNTAYQHQHLMQPSNLASHPMLGTQYAPFVPQPNQVPTVDLLDMESEHAPTLTSSSGISSRSSTSHTTNHRSHPIPIGNDSTSTGLSYDSPPVTTTSNSSEGRTDHSSSPANRTPMEDMLRETVSALQMSVQRDREKDARISELLHRLDQQNNAHPAFVPPQSSSSYREAMNEPRPTTLTNEELVEALKRDPTPTLRVPDYDAANRQYWVRRTIYAVKLCPYYGKLYDEDANTITEEKVEEHKDIDAKLASLITKRISNKQLDLYDLEVQLSGYKLLKRIYDTTPVITQAERNKLKIEWVSIARKTNEQIIDYTNRVISTSRKVRSLPGERLEQPDIILQWRQGLGQEFDHLNQQIDMYQNWPAGWTPEAGLDSLQELATSYLKQYYPSAY